MKIKTFGPRGGGTSPAPLRSAKGMQFDKTRLSCLRKSEQNCRPSFARGAEVLGCLSVVRSGVCSH